MSEIVKILGITGFPCCGKTTISKFFHEEGAYVVDLDKIGHKVLERKKIIKTLVKEFGEKIIDKETNKIKRKELAKIVLKDKKALDFLNETTWPEIRKKAEKEIKNIKYHNFCVIDGALIFEGGMESLCDATMFLDVSFETRASRALANRGWDDDLLKKIDNCQNYEAKNKADFILWPEQIPNHIFDEMMIEIKKANFDIVFVDLVEAIKERHNWKTFKDKFWKEGTK